jgi:hypothetical protein
MRFLRRQFLQDGTLPFSDVLSESIVAQALTAIKVSWLDRIYSPLVTLWVFVGQVLSADHSCRAAVARLIAHRLSQGKRPCSAETGVYCQARQRLPEEFFSNVARRTGSALESNVDSQWLWKGRRVYIYDGSTVTMPDTPENHRVAAAYLMRIEHIALDITSSDDGPNRRSATWCRFDRSSAARYSRKRRSCGRARRRLNHFFGNGGFDVHLDGSAVHGGLLDPGVTVSRIIPGQGLCLAVGEFSPGF